MNINFQNWIRNVWNTLNNKRHNSKSSKINRDTVLISVICLVIAFCLWLVVNLNRSYNINVRLPIVLGQINTNKALAQKLPREVSATVTGKGWTLIKLYKNPPAINVNVSSQQINMLKQVRGQIDNQNIAVQKVIPFYLQPKLVPRQTKKVPVIPNVNVQFKNNTAFYRSLCLTQIV